MSIKQLNFDGKDKVEVAIMRLKEFEPPEGYYLAFSGGKDSVVIYDLAMRSGVKFDTHYHRTGIDPPELVQFIRKTQPNIIVEHHKGSIWEGIMRHGLPRRKSRWCCEYLKEWGGKNRRILTGIRWAESPRRAKRLMVEVCKSDKTKVFVHPIIDWTDKEVWEYIKSTNTPYCSLYDEGFKRLGCVLCPMISAKKTAEEMVRFPKIAEAWHRATIRYFNKGTDGTRQYKTAEEMWQWWLRRGDEPKVNDAQCIMFDN